MAPIALGKLGFLLVIVIWKATFCRSITCFCNSFPTILGNRTCSLQGNKCESTNRCFYQRVVRDDGIIEVTHGCLTQVSHAYADIYCSASDNRVRRICCFNASECNRNLVLPPFPFEIVPSSSVMVSPSPTSLPGPGDNLTSYRAVTITVPILSILIIVSVTVSAILLSVYCLQKRKKIIGDRRSELHKMEGNELPVPMYSPYTLDTLDLIDQMCTSGSGSGKPLLSQRTIARSIRIGEAIGKGGFGQVFVGEFQGDKVAVKKFASRDEISWFRESEIYNTVLLRHDNILGFFACDVFSSNGTTELWLITQYHPHGSLYDYLNLLTVSPKIMMRMAISMSRGLAHLHTEFSGTSAKPAIAHRDIKSKNILVKNNRECCIADFGLAVMKGPSNSVNSPMNPKQGTKRYMAPEVLSETINMRNFESFKKVDIYAFGLVLWEICKRCCNKNDSVGDYEPPFHDMVGPDPSFEEMKKVVVMERRLPTVPNQWHGDDVLRGMLQVMKECWYFNSSARNNAIFYKNKLYKIAEEDKIEYDDHE